MIKEHNMRGRKTRYIILLACLVAGITGKAGADDTAIFGGGTVNVPPNILIIFDNSISMSETITVPPSPYNPNQVYDSTYNRQYVYKKIGSSWYQFISIGTDCYVDSTEINCTSGSSTAQDELNNKGHWYGLLRTSGTPRTCASSGTKAYYRTGNFLNWEKLNPTTKTKLQVAKETINTLLNNNWNKARFGVMKFKNGGTAKTPIGAQGGSIISQLRTRTLAEMSSVVTQVNAISADSWTPLAETLAEAGLYFAGATSHFNSGVDYGDETQFPVDTTRAIQYRCQKNYIIVMTDGRPSGDRDSILYTQGAYLGRTIGDYDEDCGAVPPNKHVDELHDGDNKTDGTYECPANMTGNYCGSHYLDDVAKFLYEEDLIPSSSDILDAEGNQYDGKQNIITYTIGFNIDDELLLSAANSTHGRGNYFTTSSNVSLEEIFQGIISEITEKNASYVAPVVPINRVNKTYAANGLYLSLFSPDSTTPGFWKGNLKKFGFDSNGVVRDRDDNEAVDSSGMFKDSAHSAWVSVSGNEGLDIDSGGVGEKLVTEAENSSRVFRTYKADGTGMIDFNTANITFSDLGLSSDSQKDNLIGYVTATGNYKPDASGAYARSWVLGDILHSQPALLYDSSQNKNVIFVGANDGFMHCFIDSDGGTPSLVGDTVTESWAFIPWDLLPNLKYLPPEGRAAEITGDAIHDYYVDGSPTIYKSGGSTYLAFGLRRGGKDLSNGGELSNQYFILNISTHTSPTHVADIPRNILTYENLGQSWSTPYFCRIKQTGGTDTQDVLLLTGGYDTNQDNSDPGAGDTKGRAVFAVNAQTGALATTNLKFFNSSTNSTYDKIKYSIVDLRAYDDDDDGCTDVVHAPSLGGEIFVFESKKKADGSYDGVWSKRLLFKAAKQDGLTTRLRKFFCAPGIAQEVGFEYVYIGSGDREHPLDTNVMNRFYAIKNRWPETWNDADPLTDSDLIDVTDDELQGSLSTPSGSEEEKKSIRTSLDTGNGWYIDMENAGEKIVSTPLVYNKVVYFTTFIPNATASESVCGGSGAGVARLYAVDYKNGEAVFKDFDGNSQLTKEDRVKTIGSGIPSEPMLVVTEKGTYILVGRDSGPNITDTNEKQSMHRYYWQKVH